MAEAATAPNAGQIDAWNTRNGLTWARLQARIDALFAPLTADLMAAAAPAPGERVLDVGCGCGAVTLEAARRVGPGGRVLGVDVSEPMLAVARERITAAGLANAAVLCADAAGHAFAPEVDLLVSRLGVMFFDDPVGAFRNLRAAVRPGGRLALLCWQPLEANPWFREPVEAVRPLLEPPPPADPDAPGPFAFAQPDRLRAVLEGAGWSAVRIEPRTPTLRLGADVAEASDLVTQVGAAARLLAAAPPELQSSARAAIAGRLAAHRGADGVALGGALWLVGARLSPPSPQHPVP